MSDKKLNIPTEPELMCSSLNCNNHGCNYCKECSHGFWHGSVRTEKKEWRWTFNSWFGIDFLKANGESYKRQPGETHEIWKIVNKWVRENFTKEYIKLTMAMINRLPEGDPEPKFTEIYKKFRDDIFKISALAEDKPLRKRGIEKENDLFDEVKKECKTKGDVLNGIWEHFIIKFIKAPTSIHTVGVIILCMPLLKRAILYYEEDKDNE